MIRINRSLTVFVGVISLLVISSFIVLQKILPLATHANYYCQSFVNSFSLPTSHYIGAIPFVLLFTFFIAAITKLLFILIKAQLMKRNLIKKSRSDTSFTLLLEKLQLIDKTYLIESNKRFAFCMGIRDPKIYISTTLVRLLSQQETEAVLRHERYHLNNRDTLTLIIASVGESLLPFFPLLSDMLRNYRIEREIKADQDAVAGIGDEKPLVAVLKKLLGSPSATMVSLAAIADQDTLEPRILMLLKRDVQFKKFKLKRILISVFSIVAMSAIALSPVQAVEIHHNGKEVIMMCQNEETCFNACKPEYQSEKMPYTKALLYSPLE